MAMSFLYPALLLLALISGVISGNTAALGTAMLQGAQDGVALVLQLSGALCLWSALSRLLEKSGGMAQLSALLRPVAGRLFPRCAEDREGFGFLCANLAANVLGFGNAATPLGVQAVQRMHALEGADDPSDELCTLIVLNSASLQLIPSTVAAVRAGLGARSAFDILPAVWLASGCSVLAGLLAARLLRGWRYFS